MAEIGRWNNHKFEVSPSIIRSFTDLQIKGSSETEDKESGGEKYVSRKNAKPIEVSFTIHLHAMLGCDVQSEAVAFVGEARAGKKDYFYLGNQKLFTYQLMLTDATISHVEIIPGGKWASANVQITMKQCDNPSGSGGSSGGGSSGGGSSSGGGGTSGKKTVTPTKTTTAKTVASALTTATKTAVSAGLAAIKKITNAAKKASASKTTGAASGGGGAKRVALIK